MSAGAVIAGGGPAGLAAAVALVQGGYKAIHVLEVAKCVDVHDPYKTFPVALSTLGHNALQSLGVAENANDDAGMLSDARVALSTPRRQCEQ